MWTIWRRYDASWKHFWKSLKAGEGLQMLQLPPYMVSRIYLCHAFSACEVKALFWQEQRACLISECHQWRMRHIALFGRLSSEAPDRGWFVSLLPVKKKKRHVHCYCFGQLSQRSRTALHLSVLNYKYTVSLLAVTMNPEVCLPPAFSFSALFYSFLTGMAISPWFLCPTKLP